MLSLALLFSFLSVPVCAGRNTKVNVQSEDALVFDILDSGKWDKVASVSSFKNTDEGSLIVYPDLNEKKTSMTFSHTFYKAVSFDGINEVCLETRVASKYENFTVKMSAYGKDGVYSDTAEGVCGKKNSLYFKFPEIVKDEIVKLQFTVTAGNELPETCTVFSVFADSCYSYSYIDLFDTVRFFTLSGKIEYREKNVRIASSGTSAVEALIAKESTPGGASVVLSISSSGSGIVHIENLSDSKKYQTALYSGTNDYTFFLDGIPEKIKIEFTHGEGGGNAQIVLNSMKLTELGKNVYESIGAVSSCELKDGYVTVKGSVTSDGAVRYIDSKLGLFRVSLDGVWETPPLEEIKISTVFELSAKEDRNTSAYRYGVAVIGEDSIYPLAEPMFATSYSDASKNYSQTAVGLLNPNSFDTFKANASCVMLDVWAGNLLAKSNSGNTVIYPYGDEIYSIDTDSYSGIKHDVSFYESLGCSVYLRIYVANENPYNEHTLKDLRAVLSYISESTNGISGYMLMPDYRTSGGDISKAPYAALVMGTLSETLRKADPECEIYYCVPEGENVFAAHLAHYAKLYGLKGISAVYTAKNENDTVSIRPSVDSAGFNHIVLCAGNSDSGKEIYESASKANVYAIILNAANGIDIDEFRKLSKRGDTYTELLTDVELKGQSSIWNFRENYSTFGFISGGAMSTPQTVETESGRALRSKLEKSSGVLLCRMDSNLNLSAADGLSVTLSLSSEADIELIVGYSNTRKVYSMENVSASSTLYAPMNGSGKIEYVAVAVTGEKGLTVDISSIGAYSSTLEDAELESSVKAPDPVIQRQATIYYIMGGGALIMTAVIFILLTKKKDDKKKASE